MNSADLELSDHGSQCRCNPATAYDLSELASAFKTSSPSRSWRSWGQPVTAVSSASAPHRPNASELSCAVRIARRGVFHRLARRAARHLAEAVTSSATRLGDTSRSAIFSCSDIRRQTPPAPSRKKASPRRQFQFSPPLRTARRDGSFRHLDLVAPSRSTPRKTTLAATHITANRMNVDVTVIIAPACSRIVPTLRADGGEASPMLILEHAGAMITVSTFILFAVIWVAASVVFPCVDLLGATRSR